MPHIHIQHYPRDFTEEQTRAIDAAITRAVMDTFHTGEEAVSITLEPVMENDWNAQVLEKIAARQELLLKTPGYWRQK